MAYRQFHLGSGGLPRVSTAPLFAYMDREDWGMGHFPESMQRRLWRWKASGQAGLFAIDEFVIHELGVHPIAVYGAAWFEERERESA